MKDRTPCLFEVQLVFGSNSRKMRDYSHPVTYGKKRTAPIKNSQGEILNRNYHEERKVNMDRWLFSGKKRRRSWRKKQLKRPWKLGGPGPSKMGERLGLSIGGRRSILKRADRRCARG